MFTKASDIRVLLKGVIAVADIFNSMVTFVRLSKNQAKMTWKKAFNEA